VAAPADDPAGLPIALSTGWRAADGDPPDGVAGIDRLDFRPADPMADQAPRAGVRWYRILVDLSPFVGQPLAFHARSLRDADEAWFDGVRIGGLGGFPPDVDSAHFVSRLYPLPTERVDSAGPRELVLRVWHGKRDGSVFRGPPVIGSLGRLERERSLKDQVLVLFAGASLVLALFLVLFAFHARSPTDYLLFAGFVAGFGVYLTSGHSAWVEASVPLSAVFRGGVLVLMTTGIFYAAAMLRFLGGGVPLLYRVLLPAFGLLGLLAPVLPNVESFVLPMRFFGFAYALVLVDLLVRFAAAAIRGRRRARTDVAGHAAFLVAAVAVADLVPGLRPLDLDPVWRVVLLGVLFAGLSWTVLWRMSEEVKRYRLSGLTDAGTRLWNRAALYEEIAERGEALRRGKGRGFGLVLADLDRFKDWNDARGHLAGDRVLLRAARALQDASRPQDFVARYGGDEYAVVVGDVDAESLPALSERLHGAVGAALAEETEAFLTSASIGTALYDGAHHRTPEDLLREADRALYEAKEAARTSVPPRIARQTPSGKWSVRL
jgi:diguanylate cyclase (GGDEF)-like protein